MSKMGVYIAVKLLYHLIMSISNMKNGVQLKCEKQTAEKRNFSACCMEAIVEYLNVSHFDWMKRQHRKIEKTNGPIWKSKGFSMKHK